MALDQGFNQLSAGMNQAMATANKQALLGKMDEMDFIKDVTILTKWVDANVRYRAQGAIHRMEAKKLVDMFASGQETDETKLINDKEGIPGLNNIFLDKEIKNRNQFASNLTDDGKRITNLKTTEIFKTAAPNTCAPIDKENIRIVLDEAGHPLYYKENEEYKLNDSYIFNWGNKLYLDDYWKDNTRNVRKISTKLP